MNVFLDTHAAVYLWEGRAERFEQESKRLLRDGILLLSPFVRLELGFLHEIGRLTVTPDEILGGLTGDGGVTVSNARVANVVERAMSMSWTRDVFDRLIVASADLQGAPLLTRDEVIREHYPHAVW